MSDMNRYSDIDSEAFGLEREDMSRVSWFGCGYHYVHSERRTIYNVDAVSYIRP